MACYKIRNETTFHWEICRGSYVEVVRIKNIEMRCFNCIMAALQYMLPLKLTKIFKIIRGKETPV